jgi:hypothetical protein
MIAKAAIARLFERIELLFAPWLSILSTNCGSLTKHAQEVRGMKHGNVLIVIKRQQIIIA